MQMETLKKHNKDIHIRQIDFKIKTAIRDKEGNYIVIKGSIQEEAIPIIKYMHPILENLNT